MTEKTRDIAERHFKRQHKKKKRFRFFMSVIFILILIFSVYLASLHTSLFGINEIKVVGNSKVESSDIKNALGVDKDLKVFSIDKELMKKRVEALPYIESAKIRRSIFGNITVEVEESNVSGYIMADTNAVIFDENGEIVHVTSDIPDDIPEVRGCSIHKKSVGEKISIDSAEKFDIILLYISEFEKAGIKDKIDVLDVSDILNVTGIYDNRYDIMFGSRVELSYKIAMMVQAISYNAENEMGTVDLRISGSAYVKPERTFVKSGVYKDEASDEDSDEKQISDEEKANGEGDALPEEGNSGDESAETSDDEETAEDGE